MAWHLTYECILIICLHSHGSSNKSKFLPPPMVFFILALMASNDGFWCTKGDEYFGGEYDLIGSSEQHTFSMEVAYTQLHGSKCM